jgi:hypothetical protein
VVGVDFAKSTVSEKLEVLGTMTLYVNDAAIATADFRTQSGHTRWPERDWPSAGTALTPYRTSTRPASRSPVAASSR